MGVTEISVGLDRAAAAAGDALRSALGGLPWLGDVVAPAATLIPRVVEVAL